MAAAVVTLSASARELLAHAPLVAVGRYRKEEFTLKLI